MCTPQIPTTPVRQATQLPDGGAPASAADTKTWNRAIIAGMATSPQGVLGTPNVGSPTLG